MTWLDWMTANPAQAIALGTGAALVLLIVIVLARLSFAAIGRRILIGLRLRKRVERDQPWATVDEQVSYGLRPLPRRWWSFRRRV
ncbi:hypothetical protein GGE65_007834 [Skermanella aerolata]|uniref:hypothetical protein n=1 Tax=Skermanella aerolata TaxID=393310 RepID=UPI003D20BE47